MVHTISTRYLLGTMLYGVARKLALFNYASTYEVYDTNNKKIEKDMLIGDRLLVIGSSSASATVLWPKYVYDDLNMLNILYRGEKLEDYGYKFKHLYNYAY